MTTAPELRAAKVADYVSEAMPHYDMPTNGEDGDGFFIEYGVLAGLPGGGETEVSVRLRLDEGESWQLSFVRPSGAMAVEFSLPSGPEASDYTAVNAVIKMLRDHKPQHPTLRPAVTPELKPYLALARGAASARYQLPRLGWSFAPGEIPAIVIPTRSGRNLVVTPFPKRYAKETPSLGCARAGEPMVCAVVHGDRERLADIITQAAVINDFVPADLGPDVDPYKRVLINLAGRRERQVELMAKGPMSPAARIFSSDVDFKWRLLTDDGAEVIGPGIESSPAAALRWAGGALGLPMNVVPLRNLPDSGNFPIRGL